LVSHTKETIMTNKIFQNLRMGLLLSAAIAFSATADRPIPARNPQIVPHGLLGGEANRVNSSGEAIGTFVGEESNEALAWFDPRNVHLGTLGGMNSAAFGVNDAGLIVGESDTSKVDRNGRVVSQAFVWDAQMHNLADSESWLDSAALGVNNAGRIVGWS